MKKISKRVEWIDFAKGITIILVIVGHTISIGKHGSILRGLIFSFHMPLFFILSIITFRCSSSLEEYKRKTILSFKHLIYPAVIMITLNNIVLAVQNKSMIMSLEWWRDRIYSFLFSSGVDLTFNGFHVSGIGIPWFFFALFLGRTIFDYIHMYFDEKQLLVVSCIIGILGIGISIYQWLPFSLDIAFAIMPFFYVGYRLKTLNVEKMGRLKNCCVWCAIWLITFFITFSDYNVWTYLELAVRRYNFFPICYITAIAGTMLVVEVGIIVCRYSKIIKLPFLYIGKNSLYLLCIHIMDYLLNNFWNVSGNQYYSTVLRILIDSIIFFGGMILIKVFKIIKAKQMK